MAGCPDWSSLADHRLHLQGEEPAAWQAAVEHLQGCGQCRWGALEADPTLLFRSLSGPVLEAGEVEEIRKGVRRMTRLERVAPRSAMRRLSIAASILLAALGVLYAAGGLAPFADSDTPELMPVAVAPSSAAWSAPPPAKLAKLPLVESLEAAPARFYQWDRADLDLVVIVDASLEF